MCGDAGAPTVRASLDGAVDGVAPAAPNSSSAAASSLPDPSASSSSHSRHEEMAAEPSAAEDSALTWSSQRSASGVPALAIRQWNPLAHRVTTATLSPSHRDADPLHRHAPPQLRLVNGMEVAVLNLGGTIALSSDAAGRPVTVSRSESVGDEQHELIEDEPVQGNALTWIRLCKLRLHLGRRLTRTSTALS